jgi:radical SAM protein with 4Fe4S-binding SPASM domain
MAKYPIQSKRGAPPQGAYSQGWRAGDFIFVTGTGPIDPASGTLVGDTIEEQTEQTIDNISAILETDSASLLDVVKVTVHLSDTRLFARRTIPDACQHCEFLDSCHGGCVDHGARSRADAARLLLSDHSRATPDAADPHGREPRSPQAEQFLHYRRDRQVV